MGTSYWASVFVGVQETDEIREKCTTVVQVEKYICPLGHERHLRRPHPEYCGECGGKYVAIPKSQEDHDPQEFFENLDTGEWRYNLEVIDIHGGMARVPEYWIGSTFACFDTREDIGSSELNPDRLKDEVMIVSRRLQEAGFPESAEKVGVHLLVHIS